LSKFDPEYPTDDVGVEAGMPRLVAWKVVEVNDMDCDNLHSWNGHSEREN
jgi:hypothetical protein